MKSVTIQSEVEIPIEKVWQLWTEPEHIVKWNAASDDWHTTRAENDLRSGGRFLSRMEAKDGSFGFDFSGTYDVVRKPNLIAYTLDDGRKVQVHFSDKGGSTEIFSEFEPEAQNPVDFQRSGWQAILDNFKRYAEKR